MNKTTTVTQWFIGQIPIHAGWYNASVERDPTCRRWWDGKYWCLPVWSCDKMSKKEIERRRTTRWTNANQVCMYWRGLANKPRRTK